MSKLNHNVLDFLENFAGPFTNPHKVTFDPDWKEETFCVMSKHPKFPVKKSGPEVSVFVQSLSVRDIINLFRITRVNDLVHVTPIEVLKGYYNYHNSGMLCVLKDWNNIFFYKKDEVLRAEHPVYHTLIEDAYFSADKPKELYRFSRQYYKSH